MSENTLDLRPAALVTSELSLPATPASSSLLGPVTSLCHILFSRALLPSPSVSARHRPNCHTRNTLLIWHCSILGEFLYTGRNKKVRVWVPVTDLGFRTSKASTEAVRPFTAAITSILPPLLIHSFFFPLSLLGMTCLTALDSETEKSSSPHRPHPPFCWWIVFVSTGVALEKWSAVISSRQAHCFHSHAHCVIAMEIREWFRPFTEGNVKSLPVKKWNYCFDGFWWRGA